MGYTSLRGFGISTTREFVEASGKKKHGDYVIAMSKDKPKSFFSNGIHMLGEICQDFKESQRNISTTEK